MELLIHDDDGEGRGSTAWDGDFWVDTEAQGHIERMLEVQRARTAAMLDLEMPVAAYMRRNQRANQSPGREHSLIALCRGIASVI